MYLETGVLYIQAVREGLTEDVIFKQQLKGGEVGSLEGPWGELPCKSTASARP